jgi:hypothetical protein
MTRLAKLAACFMCLLFLAVCPLLPAQSSSQSAQSGASPGGIMTTPLQILVTGCLKRGNQAGEYYLSDQNGTIWKLTSTSVNLAEHVQHSVTVTGKPISNPQPPADNGQAGKTQDSSKPQPGLRVLTLKMLSSSCTR